MLKILPKATGYYKQLWWSKLKVSVMVTAALYVHKYIYVHFPGLWLADPFKAVSGACCSLRYAHLSLRKYANSLSDTGMANRTFGLTPFTDPVGTFHTEQVVPTRDQGSDDLAFEAHRTVAAAFPTCARGCWGGRGGGRRRGRGLKRDPREVRTWQGGNAAGISGEGD